MQQWVSIVRAIWPVSIKSGNTGDGIQTYQICAFWSNCKPRLAAITFEGQSKDCCNSPCCAEQGYCIADFHICLPRSQSRQEKDNRDFRKANWNKEERIGSIAGLYECKPLLSHAKLYCYVKRRTFWILRSWLELRRLKKVPKPEESYAKITITWANPITQQGVREFMPSVK